ncbi:uncharacterized protein LOC132271553 [Cornus florida]|uniref:uncharacterized protein LOC132271553 n=1 Tax=Cornus florida TaxID=4283 RepID=UPI00289885AD|nr:uncharacterized protein LOC132271553 [Cornus florida]
MGFGSRWRNWIETYPSSIKFSVLVNESPTGFFGCPGFKTRRSFVVFPFSYCYRGLEQTYAKGKDLGLINGFRVERYLVHQVEISYLLFANDTLVFCDADVSQLRYLRDVQDISSLAAVLRCRVSSFPIPYLGLHLGVSSRRVGSWVPVIDWYTKRLAGWKKQYLSKGGKVTLIKSTLLSLPTYFLSMFQIPCSVTDRIEKIQRDFLWGGRGEEFKYHLVRWEQVCKSMKLGGLGIRRLVPFNQTLLGKWLWRYGTERHRPWRRLVSSRYVKESGGWSTGPVHLAGGVGVCKSIQKGWDVNLLISGSKFVIADAFVSGRIFGVVTNHYLILFPDYTDNRSQNSAMLEDDDNVDSLTELLLAMLS